MKWNVIVQVEGDDSFAVLDVLKPLQSIEGVAVGSITAVPERPQGQSPVTQIRSNSPQRIQQSSGDIPIGATITPGV